MNRRARRAAAANARRGVRTGYEHRLLAAGTALADQFRGKVVHAVCEHDQYGRRGQGVNHRRQAAKARRATGREARGRSVPNEAA